MIDGRRHFGTGFGRKQEIQTCLVFISKRFNIIIQNKSVYNKKNFKIDSINKAYKAFTYNLIFFPFNLLTVGFVIFPQELLVPEILLL